MKAIFTKWIGPTTTKPARIKAYDGDNSRTWSFDGLDDETRYPARWEEQLKGYRGPWIMAGTNHAAHYEAARRFVAAMKWNKADGTLVTLADGGTKEGYVWVMLD